MGFEPTVPFPARRFSRPLPSTTRSPFLGAKNSGQYNKKHLLWLDSPKASTISFRIMADEGSEFDYKPDKEKKISRTSGPTVTWTASEYIDHERGMGWYALLLLATLIIAALTYLITKDYFATGTIVALGIIVGLFVRRKPQEITYELSARGLKADAKEYEYSLFKSFSIVEDGAMTSLSLYPVKRFMPPISVYFAPEQEEKIVKVIGEHLPYEERKLDSIDRLSRRLRL